MSCVLESPEALREVAVREQRIIGPGGAETVLRTAACPVQERSIPLPTCQACPRKVSLSLDVAGHQSRLVCRVPERPGGVQEAEEGMCEARVSGLMSRRVISVRGDMPERAVLMLLVEHGITGAPVVDGAGRPVGVISMTDLLREQYDAIEDEEDELLPHWVRGAVERHRPTHEEGRGERPPRTAAELMTPSVVSVREEATVPEAAALMTRYQVHRLPVVSGEGAVVGMISSLDLVRWIGLATSPPSIHGR